LGALSDDHKESSERFSGEEDSKGLMRLLETGVRHYCMVVLSDMLFFRVST
jgi:hypothetical protein